MDHLSIPIPPEELQRQVLGQAVSQDQFLYGGYMVAQGLRETLAVIGRPLESFESVLDLGCGCGRVLRWLPNGGGQRFHGSDISAAAIAWDRKHLGFGSFEVNQPEPPLGHPDASFDLVIAISVVTHLPEDMQLRWLQEVKRVLRPGGLVLMTVAGEGIARWRLSGRDRAAFEADGHLYERVAAGGLHGLPEFYQNAYHSRAYVERVWSRFFRLKAYLRGGPMYLQDLVVLEERPSENAGGSDYVWVELPICSIGSPRAGSEVDGPALTVWGSVFFPRGGVAEIDVGLDDRRVARVLADQATVAVGAAYPAWPSAASSGFAATLNLAEEARGLHTVKLTTSTSQIASCSTFFFLR